MEKIDFSKIIPLEQCLNGLATKEEEDEFNSLIGKEV